MRRTGFSLVELLIVLSIATTVFTIGTASYNRFSRRERIKQIGETLKSTLRFAQTKAMSMEKPSTGCTTFTGMRVSFTGASYSVQHECAPEGLAGTSSSVSFGQSGVTFVPVPSSFTFHTDGTLGTGSTEATLSLTNGTETYVIAVSPSGNVSDRGM